jgi:hypothetical protein
MFWRPGDSEKRRADSFNRPALTTKWVVDAFFSLPLIPSFLPPLSLSHVDIEGSSVIV